MKKLIVLVMLVAFASCTEEKKPEFDLAADRAFEKGKYVGRNAMMIYIGRQDLKDSTISIELTELLKIEDSLSVVEIEEQQQQQ